MSIKTKKLLSNILLGLSVIGFLLLANGHASGLNEQVPRWFIGASTIACFGLIIGSIGVFMSAFNEEVRNENTNNRGN